MKVVNVFEWKKSVQRSVNRGGDGIAATSAERIHLDDFIFELHAAIAIPQGMQLVKVESRENGLLYAPNIAAASFDPKNRAFSTVEWIGFLNFGTGVSAAKICDSKVGA